MKRRSISIGLTSRPLHRISEIRAKIRARDALACACESGGMHRILSLVDPSPGFGLGFVIGNLNSPVAGRFNLTAN
jgi:hypothetical protein